LSTIFEAYNQYAKGKETEASALFVLNQLLVLPTVVRLSDFARNRVRGEKVLPPLGAWVTEPRAGRVNF